MSKVENPKSRVEETVSEELSFVDGELMENSPDEEDVTIFKTRNRKRLTIPTSEDKKPKTKNQESYLQYIVIPLIFLTATLLGGLRLNAEDAAFLFLKPPLVCLIFAVILLVLFFRANLIRLNGWFSENFSSLKNTANACVLLTLFFASTQIFNSLLPEKGLPFWVVAFCFFWTLWNNLFADFDTKRLVQSLGGMFGLAFVVKYLILAGLTAPANRSWIQGIFENPTQEAFTFLLDLPKFAPATGYIQFFALVFYLIGLFLLKPEISDN
jgi:hypothetical protein